MMNAILVIMLTMWVASYAAIFVASVVRVITGNDRFSGYLGLIVCLALGFAVLWLAAEFGFIS